MPNDCSVTVVLLKLYCVTVTVLQHVCVTVTVLKHVCVSVWGTIGYA